MQDGDHDDDPRTDWAERRTDWAEDRTLLANERTFAGWMRTGLGAVAVAIGLKAVFGEFEPTWAAKAVASIFILAALVALYAAQRNARLTRDRLDRHTARPLKGINFALIAAVLAAGALGTGFILWSL
jgi:putative membrane protein